MTSITGLFLALTLTMGWSVDGQTDQPAVAKLRKAAEAGRVEELARGIADASPELLDTLAQRATCSAQLDALRFLVEKGARVERFGPGGLYCLLMHFGNVVTIPARPDGAVLEIERYLLGKGMGLRDRFVDGESLLSAAVHTCRLSLVEPLLGSDADINIATIRSGETPLMRAVRCPQDVAGLLLRHGADRRAKSKAGTTAIGYLLDAKLDETVFRQRLAALVPSSPLDDPAALLEAARRGIAVAVDGMLEAGAATTVVNWEGNTPLHLAAMAAGCPRCIEVLLAKGAKVDALNRAGDTPLHLAASHTKGCPRCIEALLAKGAKVDARNQGGATPLHLLAAHCGGTDCEASAKLLIAAGSDLGARDDAKLTPFDVALKTGHASVVGHLLGKLEFKPLASFGATVTASGTLVEKGRPADFYAPSEAFDGSTQTCWCVRDPKVEQTNEYEFSPGWSPSHTVWIEVRLPKPMRIRAARIYPGCTENRSIFDANNRVSVYWFGRHGDSKMSRLADEMRFQDLEVQVDRPVEYLRFEILTVYPGKKFFDTCVAEIQAITEEVR